MTEPLAPDESVADIIQGGGRPRRQLPRSLVIGFYAICGIAALAWVGVTVLNRADDPVAKEPPTLTVVGSPQTWYRQGHGELVVTLSNNSETPLILGDVAISDDEQHGDGRYLTWVRAAIVDEDLASLVSVTTVTGTDDQAELKVTVDPPCAEPALPMSAKVTFLYHTILRYGVLEVVSPTQLQSMVHSACNFEP